MEFEYLQDAVEYAKENKKDVKRYNGKWKVIDRLAIPIEKQLFDIELAMEQTEDKEIIEELKTGWNELKNTMTGVVATGQIVSGEE